MEVENPIRIIRSGKPSVCKNCKNRDFQKVLYGMPDEETWNDKNYDCRGCCLPPFIQLKTSEGTYFFPEPKYSCSKCGLEIYIRSEAEEFEPIDDSSYFYAEEWRQQDESFISSEVNKMKNKIQERDGIELMDEFASEANKVNTIKELNKLKEKYRI